MGAFEPMKKGVGGWKRGSDDKALIIQSEG